MQFLKNKHLIMAMFVAPILAIIAYFSVDYYVSETPHAALQGASYQLVAKSNCRYKSGKCTLENGDIEVNLRAQAVTGNQLELVLTSAMPIQSVLVSFVDDGKTSQPTKMLASSEAADTWSAILYKAESEQSELRLALNISETLYYAETSTIFIDYETIFSRDNFSK